MATSSTNWGDGDVETINRESTGPWPDGYARHAYIKKGHYAIVVTEILDVCIDPPPGSPVLPLDTAPRLELCADKIQAGVN